MLAVDEVVCLSWRSGGDDIKVSCQLLAEDIKWKIIDVITEGVFDFGTDGGNAVDDVGSSYYTLVWRWRIKRSREHLPIVPGMATHSSLLTSWKGRART